MPHLFAKIPSNAIVLSDSLEIIIFVKSFVYLVASDRATIAFNLSYCLKPLSYITKEILQVQVSQNKQWNL